MSERHPAGAPVNDFLPLSIVSIFCCLPCGLVALCFSIKTRDANHYGDRDRALKNSSVALTMGIISVIVGLMFLLFSTSFRFFR